MKFIGFKKFFRIFLLTIILNSLFYIPSIFYIPRAQARINLVKTSLNPAVYYIDESNIRHVFPNSITFKSWYKNFDQVVTVSEKFLATFPLGKNITVRSGKFLVKTKLDPKVYAVEPGGILRHIEDESIAEDIYGQDWSKKVIDIPDVFFDDYLIGEPIKYGHLVPDGTLYQIKDDETLFWKNKGVLQPFASEKALLDNNYTLEDMVLGITTFYQRKREVTDFDKRISNPFQEPQLKTRDCENKNLKVAFIFLTHGDKDLEELEKIQLIKDKLPEFFSWALDNLASVDVSYPLVRLEIDRFLTDDQNEILLNEVAFSFYDSNPDVFDFLIIYNNFKKNEKATAFYTPVSNWISGDNKILLDRSENFGSLGKLKGIINMGNINKYSLGKQEGLDMAENYLLHEMLHHFSGAISFIDENNERNWALLREKDLNHWSDYVDFISPLGGLGWQDNKDGTFTSKVSLLEDTSRKKFSELDLYLLGLLPARAVKPIMYLEPREKGLLSSTTIEATGKYVTIDQIIAAHGEWRCKAK